VTTTDRWSQTFSIQADDVTLRGLAVTGGGQVVTILGRSRVRVADSTFTNPLGSAIAIWGEGRGSHDVTIERVTITGTLSGRSPIMGRSAEQSNPCATPSRRLVVRDSRMDNGWFGIELKCFEDVTLTGNDLRGGNALMSFPDSNRVRVEGNTVRLESSAYWGVEVPRAHDVVVTRNLFTGSGPGGSDHAVSLNSGSRRTSVTFNDARDLRTLVDLGGDGTVITDNCLTNVLRVTEFESSGTNVTVARNGPC
jgi:hypothetical protein